MSNLNQFIGGARVPTSLVTESSDGTIAAYVMTENAKTILSGDTGVAGTLKTMLTITGAGAIRYLAAKKVDSTARTLRLKVTIDGVAVFDATTASDATTGGLVAIGVSRSVSPIGLSDVAFNESLLVEVASSVPSELNKIQLATIYETR